MANFYERMGETATRLITKFSQGAATYIPKTDGVNPWDAKGDGTPISFYHTKAQGPDLNRYISGGLVVASDLVIIASLPDGVVPSVGEACTIEGVRYQIIMADPKTTIPASPICFALGLRK